MIVLNGFFFVDDSPNGVNFVNTSTLFRHFFGSKLFVLSLSRGQVNRAPLMWEKFQLLIQVSSAPKVPVEFWFEPQLDTPGAKFLSTGKSMFQYWRPNRKKLLREKFFAHNCTRILQHIVRFRHLITNRLYFVIQVDCWLKGVSRYLALVSESPPGL